MAASPNAPSEAVRVGRGALFIALAKVVFLISGAVTNFVLAGLLPPEAYGDYGVTIRVVSLVNMMVVQGMLQGMSRAVAREPGSAAVLRMQGLRGAALVAVMASGALAIASPFIASMLGDGRLATLLMLSAAITFSYSFYAALVGVVNGLQGFRTQALLDMGFSTMKTVGILGGAALGLGAAGSVGGFGAAALIMAGLTFTLVPVQGGERPDKPLSVSSLLAFSGWVMGYQALMNLLMFVDLGLVRRAVGLHELPDAAAGLYAAAVNMAQVPYLGCTAITFIIFPLLGRSNSELDADTARAMVEKAVRYALLIIMPPAVAFMAAAPGAVTAIFPERYAGAAEPLRILAGAYVATALASVMCTMLNALGRPQLSALAVLLGALVSGSLGTVLIPTEGMHGAAMASAAGMTSALVASAAFLYRTGRARFPVASIARHAVVGAVALAVSRFVTWPSGDMTARLVGLGGTVLAALGTIVLLVVVRELGRDEWQLLMQVIRRRRGGAS